MKNPHGIKVGQTLWFVPRASYLGRPRDIVVTQVGRVWIYATTHEGAREYRFSLEHLHGDSGRLVVDRDAYEKANATNKAWQQLVRDLRDISGYSGSIAPDGITLEKIEDIRMMIGLPGGGA